MLTLLMVFLTTTSVSCTSVDFSLRAEAEAKTSRRAKAEARAKMEAEAKMLEGSSPGKNSTVRLAPTLEPTRHEYFLGNQNPYKIVPFLGGYPPP